MAQAVRVLGWNIENYGVGKDFLAGDDLIKFIAEVIRSKTIDIAAICEMRQDWADKIGLRLKKELGGKWEHFASEAFVPGRNEEYLFVWNGATVANQKISGTKAGFQDAFFDQGKKIGFRLLTKDRPPVMGEFTAVTSKGKLRVSVLHSPEPKSKLDPRDAARNLATVAELRPKKMASVIVGDFNVKKSAKAADGNYGWPAFDDLVTAGFAQLLANDELTSLRSRKRKNIAKPGDCVSQPYDQIFVWTDKVATHANPKVEDLVADALIPNSAIAKALLPLLNKLGKNASKIGSCAEAFEAYRNMVSDHYPVSVTINC
jgi:endonuclease/exonuclease/phosphatase family protein